MLTEIAIIHNDEYVTTIFSHNSFVSPQHFKLCLVTKAVTWHRYLRHGAIMPAGWPVTKNYICAYYISWNTNWQFFPWHEQLLVNNILFLAFFWHELLFRTFQKVRGSVTQAFHCSHDAAFIYTSAPIITALEQQSVGNINLFYLSDIAMTAQCYMSITQSILSRAKWTSFKHNF